MVNIPCMITECKTSITGDRIDVTVILELANPNPDEYAADARAIYTQFTNRNIVYLNDTKR